MATTPSQKTTAGGSSSSQRRRLAAEAARKPRVVFPTLLQPDPEDSVPTMSIADSALLRATLVQSRHNWTHTTFNRFIPEPPARGPGGKKFASELTPAGLCTVCIGPHMFLDTKFFNIYNPIPPPVVPVSTPSTAPNTGTTTPTSTDPVANSPPATPPVVLGGSPAPERVIELIMARTANMAAEAAAAGVIPESLGPTPMDIDTNIGGSSSNTTSILSKEPTQPLTTAASATRDEEPTLLAQIKTEAQEKSISTSQASSPATPTASGTKGKALVARSQRPRHQVAFEFKENPNVRWLFPHETSLERTPPDGEVPGKISASFFLPTMEEARGGMAGATPGATSPLVPGPGQATTMVILQATPELWTGLTQSINDSAATYRFMMDKLKHIPPRHYVQYKLPVDFPDEQLHPMGLKKLPDNRVVPLTSLQPSKRKSELAMESQLPVVKAKKPKAGQDEPPISKPPAPAKKAPAPTPTPTPAIATAATFSSSTQKKCSYCDSVSTPMWRRGPNGPGTLCNACGVKWKHGKILEDASEKATPIAKPTVAVVATVAPPTMTVPAPAPVSVASTGISALTTTAEAAARMHHGLSATGSAEPTGDGGAWNKGGDGQEIKTVSKKAVGGSRKKDSCASEDSSASDAVRSTDGEKGETKTGKKRSASKAGLSGSPGPKLVPINLLGEKQAGKLGGKKDKEKPKSKPKEKVTKEKVKEKEKDKGKETIKEKSKDSAKGIANSDDKTQDLTGKAESDQSKDKDADKDAEEKNKGPDANVGQPPPVKIEGSTQSSLSSPSSQETPASISSSATASPTVAAPTSASLATTKLAATASAKSTTAKSATTKAASTKAAATPKPPKTKAAATASSPTTTGTTASASAVKTTVSTATTAGAKLELLRTYAGAVPKYQVTHAAAVATAHLADDGLALYATKNLYTNNTATFPLHFPTISIAFGPNNAYYTYPNCAVVLFENHFQIKLIHAGERAEIDVYKEGIEGTEFQVIDVGDGESMIVMKALLRQHLSRFDKELLNPDKNENSMVFRFRERLDGGGPPVKPLLEQWLTTEIPVAGVKPAALKKP